MSIFSKSLPPAVSPYNPTDIYSDVLTVLMAQYEANLIAKIDVLKAKADNAKSDLNNFIKDYQKEVKVMAEANCFDAVFAAFKTKVSIPDISGYDPIQVFLEKGLVSVMYQHEITVDNELGYLAEKDQYRSRADYDYHNYATRETRIKKYFPIDQSVIDQGLKLKKEQATLSQQLWEVECLRSQISSKERQIKAVVAQKKLDAFGMSDMLNDPKLTAMISLDADLTKLVEVK
jgi:hypothetical protein